jgi:hypothetical protein
VAGATIDFYHYSNPPVLLLLSAVFAGRAAENAAPLQAAITR